MTKPAKTKTDNIGGVLYEAARKSKIRNPRFKAAFIATIPREKNYSKTVHALIHRYKQTGELKCECCGADNVYFKFHKENGRVTFKAFVKVGNGEQPMTVDHDLLKSLGGVDSVGNYNPMCYRCNQLRGSRFAGFKEFKEWYDAQEYIDTISGLPDANFCFIDYALNKNNNQFFNNIAGSKTLPPKLVLAMKKTMRTPAADPFAHITIKELIGLDRDYANQLLNELVYERSTKVNGCRDVPMGDHDFFIGCNCSTNNKIKHYIEEHVKAQLRKRKAMQHQINIEKYASTATASTGGNGVDVKKVNTEFTFKSLWNKFTKIFA